MKISDRSKQLKKQRNLNSVLRIKWFSIFFLATLLPVTRAGLIVFPEKFEESPVEFNIDLYKEPTFNRPQSPSTTFKTNEMIYIEVIPRSSLNPQVKITVENYWATPSSSPDDSTQIEIIKNRCPTVRPFSISINQNGQSQKAQVQHQVFKFPTSSYVTMHFDVRLCINECSANCSRRRKRRAMESIPYDVIRVVSKRLHVVDGVTNQSLTEKMMQKPPHLKNFEQRIT